MAKVTPSDILETIKAHEVLRRAADHGSDATVADLIRTYLPKVHSGKRLRESDVLRILGPVPGDAAMRALATVYPAVAAVLRSEGLDLAAGAAPAFLGNLVQQQVLTEEQAEDIANDFLVYVEISAGDVSDTLAPYRQDGKIRPIQWNQI